jgi:hypothetical protein
MTAFRNTYQAILDAGLEAAALNDRAPLSRAISDAKMSTCPAEDPKFVDLNEAFELIVEAERLLVQYRWYDTSKTFSIQPDMNVYRVRLTHAGTIVAEKEIRFLDKT